MLILKKLKNYFCYTVVLAAVLAVVACATKTTDPVPEDENLALTGENLVGTWQGNLGGVFPNNIVISSATNVNGGSFWGLQLLKPITSGSSTISNFTFTNLSLDYDLTNTNGKAVYLSQQIDAASAAVFTNIITTSNRAALINALGGDTNAAIQLSNVLDGVAANDYLVYPIVPVSITKKTTGETIMRAYALLVLININTSENTAKAASKTLVAGLSTNAIYNDFIFTFTKQ